MQHEDFRLKLSLRRQNTATETALFGISTEMTQNLISLSF